MREVIHTHLAVTIHQSHLFFANSGMYAGKRKASQQSFRFLASLQRCGLTALILAMLTLTACAPGSFRDGFPGTALNGLVKSDSQPLSNSSVQLYAAGMTGDGSASTALLSSPVATDFRGAFLVPAIYKCPSSSALIYAVATGGNPNLSQDAENSNIAEMAVLGNCGSMTSDSSIAINEITTVAAVWLLAPYMQSEIAIGSGDADRAAFDAAAAQIAAYVNPTTGLAPGALPGGYGAPTSTLNTLADILAACTDSRGGKSGDGSPCGSLLSVAATHSEIAPSNTISALLSIAKQPTSQVRSVFDMVPAGLPFQPVLHTAPADWTMALKRQAAGISGPPAVGTHAGGISSEETSPTTRFSSKQAALASPASSPFVLSTSQELPGNSTFILPATNACRSSYDRFYGSEPGVYAYWALCEAGSPIQIYDYVGQFDLTTASQSFGSGAIAGGNSGPIQDGETAASVPTASYHIEGQGIPLNTNQGSVSSWIKSDATSYLVTAVFFGAVGGKSSVSIGVNASKVADQGMCFDGTYINAQGVALTVQKCGYGVNTWHRTALTWSAGVLSLYVDGISVTTGQYTGTLDNKVFYYRLFPGCCNTGKQMTLAKVSVSNQAWSSTQTKADFSPIIHSIPSGGVYVTSQTLGTIHRDVLGYADNNQNISTPAVRASLISGLTKGGFTSLRYGGGYGGIAADLENWRGGTTCTKQRGVTGQAQNVSTANNIDTYLPNVAKTLGLDVVYTVNYGTNPSGCNTGGDPIANGADLVQYANLTKGYGIKYWEIGNEVPSATSETDFHPNPNTGASYLTYEPAFYDQMKAKDPTIKIGVPIGLATFAWQSGFDLPVLAGASYDAVIWHNYPMTDPITDGATLYQDRVTSTMHRTRGALLKLQTELLNSGKSPDAIWVTEWNGEVSGNKWSKQTMGAATPLFVTSQLAEYMQAGAQLATWWEQGNPNGCSTLNYDGNGETAYSWWECGATGVVYAGPTPGHGEVATGQQPGDLMPAGRAFQILSQSGFVTEGEHMLRTDTDDTKAPWLLSYAATHGSSYAIILINRDRDSPHTVPVSIADKASGQSTQQWTYGRAQYDGSRAGNWSEGPVLSSQGPWLGTFNATLPPWSVNVIVFNK